ncbi:MAG: zinc ribbon domain-containing protein [Conexivisphaerales archaeon]
MTYCSKCGSPLDPGAAFCRQCGQGTVMAGGAAVPPAPPVMVQQAPASALPSILSGDGLDLLFWGFVIQFFGFILVALGGGHPAVTIIGLIVLLLGYASALYGLHLFRISYRSRQK